MSQPNSTGETTHFFRRINSEARYFLFMVSNVKCQKIVSPFLCRKVRYTGGDCGLSPLDLSSYWKLRGMKIRLAINDWKNFLPVSVSLNRSDCYKSHEHSFLVCWKKSSLCTIQSNESCFLPTPHAMWDTWRFSVLAPLTALNGNLSDILWPYLQSMS